MRSRRKFIKFIKLINRDVHRHFERQKSGKNGTSHIYLLFYLNKTLNILGMCNIDKNKSIFSWILSITINILLIVLLC